MKKTDDLPNFRKKKLQKKWMRGILLFSPVIALLCLVTAIYVASYYEKLQQELQQDLQHNLPKESDIIIQAGQKDTTLESEHQILDIPSQGATKEEQQGLPVDDRTDIYITPRMTYTLETYDTRSRQLAEEIRPIPTDMYGLNREELEQYLTTLAETEKSPDSQISHHYQVTLFSRRAFTVRLTITEKEPEYVIFLIAEEGWLTAYTGDRTAVYEELHIPLGDFPLEQQAMLTQGIYMKTLADYYDFLESYSS